MFSEKSVTVRVPGTTANCGPGFDSLGIACSIYNELTMELTENEFLEISVEGAGAEDISDGPDNIVWTSVKLFLERAGLKERYRGARMHMVNQVPLSRGLGSSATAIVTGIYAANAFCGSPMSKHDMLQLATEMEGHPDNVAPALYGGFTISTMKDGRADTMSFMPKLDLKLIVAVPDFYLSTSKARAVLPEKITRAEAIYNISRAAMLAASLARGDREYLASAIDDAIHQPYRAQLIPGMYDVFEAARNAGAFGAALSGAGPCVIAFAENGTEAIGMAMKEEFAKHNVKAEILQLSIDKQGAYLL